ncbi:MAG: neutral/alkaline non-lysosomal ceramidase N-terminal domain-containing protein [Candidatus Hodarchaeota archaeon]
MTLKIGIGEVVITPPIGIALVGYVPRDSHSIGINDDLHARALVFSDGTTHAAVVIHELIALTPEIVVKVRELVGKATPIPPENIILAAIHTHSGPGPQMLGIKHMKGFEDVFDKYFDLLPYHISGLIYHCFNHLKEYNMSIATKGNVKTGHHRRIWDQGSNYVDTELTVLKVDDGKECKGCVYNIGTHPVKMNPDNFYITADFPGYASKALKRIYGEKCVPIFFNGPCGNINPWNQPFTNPKSTFEECEQLGTLLAGEVMAALGTAEEITSELKVKSGEKRLTIPDDPEDPDDIHVTIQAIVLGDVLSIVGVPGEMFSKFGRIIKDGVKTKYCIVQELLANDILEEGRISYIPTKEAMQARDEDHPFGGYEVTAGVPNPEFGYIIADEAIKLVNDLLKAIEG